MKNLYLFLCLLFLNFSLLVSCSTEGEAKIDAAEKASVSFEVVIKDLAKAAQKSHIGDDLPECSSETPDYVEIVLMQGDTYLVGTAEEPFRINLEEGRNFTVEDPILELVPGNYTLVHFSVYNQSEELLWIAPRRGSTLGNFIQNPLPLQINLSPGVKKYIEVSVLCFDNREVTEYGYQFMELDTNEALKYCFFANYCDDTGRHYPAWFRVSIWAGLNDQGTELYTWETNTTGYIAAEDDFFADPVCFILPDNEEMDEEYLYYEVTLLDWPENYGEVSPEVISGTLSKRDILQNYVGGDQMEYEHLRFNCETGETDSDGDGIPDNDDECPNEAGELDTGCPGSDCVSDQPCSADFSDNTCIIGYFDFPGNHENSYRGMREPFPALDILEPSTGRKLGVANFSRNDSHDLVVTINSEAGQIGSYNIELHPEGNWECLEYECQNDADLEEVEEIFDNFSSFYWIRVKVSFCPTES